MKVLNIKKLLQIVKGFFYTDDAHFRRIVGKSYIVIWKLKHLFPTDDAHWKRVMGDSFPIPRCIRIFYNKNNQNNKIQDSHKSSPSSIVSKRHTNLINSNPNKDKEVQNECATKNPSDIFINPFKESENSSKNSLDRIREN